ncbi:MAG: hypothetical protein GYA21_00785, partial [Myxococcales bacterium]|nr:hypothetical protein [Myxococcales bacterium]
ESYHWMAFDPVACVAPDALVADGSNFFAYCGYDPVNCTDPMGGFKVPRPIPLPDDGKEKDAEEWEMPVEAVTVHRPSDSASTQTSADDILDEVPVSSWAPKPPTLPDMREADCSGNGPQERVVSPGPDVATRHDIGMVQVAEVFIPGRLPPIFRWFGGPKSSRIPRGAPVIQRMYRNPGPPPIKNAPRTMSPNLNIPKSTPGFQLLRLIDQVLRFLNNLPQPPPGTNMIPAIHTLPDVDKCGPGECIIGSYPAKVSDIVV